MAKLLVQESNGAREFELVDNEVNIGRELDNTLRLADPSISRHHAVLRRTATGYEVQDLGSSNGVLINGVKVETGALKDGDRITLGQMQLTFVDPQPAEAMNPLGTVRMSLDEMAKIQGGPPEPPPIALAAAAPMPPPAPVPPAPVPPPPRPQAPQAAPGDNPAPAFLQPYLPEIPDDAQPLIAGGAIERGDFGTRFVAWLIDGCIGVLVAILFIVAVAVLGAVSHGLGLALGCLLYPLVSLGYLVFMLWCMVKFRATLGKKIMKLRVVPEANPTGNIDWGQAILRLVGHVVSSFLFYLPYLLILGADRKGFQDMFSGSIVIKVDR
ncbi:FHA domain-containing protein [Mesoterricola silvestris]|uniref:FHA domain-containing protein n=1 Tax=Mesoterricola silvestris TaxID=2927979 RepID=A0AA48GNS3_9BACT|nr:FHA domain-containing protein [Mesoterricola silvestris]BDU74802.1 hypothetical protein METEAL_39760 [Mesoterricola silvestris]